MSFQDALGELEQFARGRAGFIGCGRGGMPGQEHLVLYVGAAWVAPSGMPGDIGHYRVEVRETTALRPLKH